MTPPDVNANAVLGTGIDAAAIKPTRSDVSRAAALPFRAVVVDYEGPSHVPDRETLAELATEVDELRVTVPIRADGFDPIGERGAFDALPAGAKCVLVAGHPAYLEEHERRRSVSGRLEVAVDRADDPWVGTEGIERLALATGATQFLLLSPTTERDIRGLRDGGFEGEVAVYAPTVLADDLDVILDAIGPYAGRRRPVRESLPDGVATDSRAKGRVRDVLSDACEEYALVGPVRSIRSRVDALRRAGADRVVGYPAHGLGAFGVRD